MYFLHLEKQDSQKRKKKLKLQVLNVSFAKFPENLYFIYEIFLFIKNIYYKNIYIFFDLRNKIPKQKQNNKKRKTLF